MTDIEEELRMKNNQISSSETTFSSSLSPNSENSFGSKSSSGNRDIEKKVKKN